MLPSKDFSDGLLMDEGRSWEGFLCMITCLLFECVFAAVRNLAFIQAPELHHQGEHGEQPGCMRLSSLWGMDTLFCVCSALNAVRDSGFGFL